MRIGKSVDPELDINHQLGLFTDMAGTCPKPYCIGLGLQGKKYRACSPLFPKFRKGPGGNWVVDPDPTLSPALI
jgi:hypothetical protein